jgi:pyridinium-3,5-bisthiocarboxylic acid mononucleotide nickel chelatase
MTIAYLDCFSGISGNMLLGALLDLGGDAAALAEDLAGLKISGWELKSKRVRRGGLQGTLAEVEVKATQPRRNLSDILSIICESKLPPPVQKRAGKVFRLLAEAESKVHGEPVSKIHFHEVGAVDAIVDIVGTVALLYRLGVEKVYCSPIPLGRGWVESAHGPLPLPAPATAKLLHNIPTYGVDLTEELVTPTGAALAVGLAEAFGPQPPMTIKATGFGAGSREFSRPNLLRVFLGAAGAEADDLLLLETNIDDLNPQLYENVMERLLAAGAVEVYLTPVIMKKSRPGVVVSLLCPRGTQEKLLQIIFAETTTLGVRMTPVARRCLAREFKKIATTWGEVTIKVARLEGKIISAQPEYEDCRKLAEQNKMDLRLVYEEAKAAAWQAGLRPAKKGKGQ